MQIKPDCSTEIEDTVFPSFCSATILAEIKFSNYFAPSILHFQAHFTIYRSNYSFPVMDSKSFASSKVTFSLCKIDYGLRQRMLAILIQRSNHLQQVFLFIFSRKDFFLQKVFLQ
jgi:hypothetical protein